MDMTYLIIIPCWRKFVWIVPTIVIILSLISGPLLLTDPVFAEEKIPNKFVPDRFIVVLKDDVDRDEFLKTHDVEKIKQYKHALNGLAVNFFFKKTATTEIYPLPLPAALPI